MLTDIFTRFEHRLSEDTQPKATLDGVIVVVEEGLGSSHCRQRKTALENLNQNWTTESVSDVVDVPTGDVREVTGRIWIVARSTNGTTEAGGGGRINVEGEEAAKHHTIVDAIG